jgi:DNA-binding response OmpR family regulator
MESRVLFVDDDAAMRDVVGSALGRRGFEVVCQASGVDAMATLVDQEFDAIATDLQMAGMDGLEFCRRAMERRPSVPVIVVTAFGSMETAVGAIRAGAYDFIAKPLQMDDLVFRLTRAVQHRQLGEEVKRLRTAVEAVGPGGHLVGDSPPMKEVYTLLNKCGNGCDGAHHRRERHEQAVKQAVREHRHQKRGLRGNKLRCGASDARKRALRSCEGSLHGREDQPTRPVRARERWHSVPRRNR